MIIRSYRESDSDEILELFRQTVHTVCAEDYRPEQLNAWAPESMNKQEWKRRFLNSHTLVAEDGNRIAGFGNLMKSGLIDCLYIHKDHQRQGVASALTAALEEYAKKQGMARLETAASITAQGFFERQAYSTIKRQTVCRQGQYLTNYVMEKYL